MHDVCQSGRNSTKGGRRLRALELADEAGLLDRTSDENGHDEMSSRVTMGRQRLSELLHKCKHVALLLRLEIGEDEVLATTFFAGEAALFEDVG